MSRSLHCLGTAGYHPNDRRHTSCYFLPQDGILLDAGSGLFRCFDLIETDTLHILLSHGHLDHVCGLTFLWNAIRVHPGLQIHVWVEGNKLALLRAHLFSHPLFPPEPNIQWHELPHSCTFDLPGGASVRWFALEHPGGSVGYRIDWPERALAYITDTAAGPDEAYWHTVRDTDLLIHECNFREAQVDFAARTGHTDLGSLLRCLERHRPKRVLLTHFNPVDDDLSAELRQALVGTAYADSGLELAADEMIIDF